MRAARGAGSVGGRAVTVEKTLTLDGRAAEASYRDRAGRAVRRRPSRPRSNLTLLAGDAPDRYYRVAGRELPDERRWRRAASAGGRARAGQRVGQFFVRAVVDAGRAPLWRHPLETASQSEGGFERTYQGSVLVAALARRSPLGDGQHLRAAGHDRDGGALCDSR